VSSRRALSASLGIRLSEKFRVGKGLAIDGLGIHRAWLSSSEPRGLDLREVVSAHARRRAQGSGLGDFFSTAREIRQWP
jgi:hypothetical protein